VARQLTDQDLEDIIVQGDSEKLVSWAETLGTGLAQGGLTTSQIRNIFGTARQIEMQGYTAPAQRRQLLLLKPRLAYARGKETDRRKKSALQTLEDVLSPAIDLVGPDEDRFRNFYDFFEAILAYHRAEGGRE